MKPNMISLLAGPRRVSFSPVENLAQYESLLSDRWSPRHTDAPDRQPVLCKSLEIPAGNPHRPRQYLFRCSISKAGNARAVRAVGTAIGKNPISWLIPCHRALRKDGSLGGYHWGLGIKRAMLAYEAIQSAELKAIFMLVLHALCASYCP